MSTATTSPIPPGDPGSTERVGAYPDPTGTAHGAEPGFADLIKSLRDETLTLFKQEVALARTEVTEKAKQAAVDTAKVPVGAALAYLGLGLLLMGSAFALAWLFAVIDIALLLPALALAFAIVGIIGIIIGIVVLKTGISGLANDDFTPDRTIESTKETAQWAKEKATR